MSFLTMEERLAALERKVDHLLKYCGIPQSVIDALNEGIDPGMMRHHRLEQETLRRYHEQGKIQAIKYYREETGLGLKDAKEAVEHLVAHGMTAGGSAPGSATAAPVTVPDDDPLEDVRDALRRGRKIEAIKRYREIMNVGLREAKEAVERMDAGGPSNAW